jgi:hypothetical protein
MTPGCAELKLFPSWHPNGPAHEQFVAAANVSYNRRITTSEAGWNRSPDPCRPNRWRKPVGDRTTPLDARRSAEEYLSKWLAATALQPDVAQLARGSLALRTVAGSRVSDDVNDRGRLGAADARSLLLRWRDPAAIRANGEAPLGLMAGRS